MNTATQDDDFRLSEQATEWLLALEESNDPQLQAQFREWLYRSAHHMEEFLLVSALFRKLDGIDRSHHIDVQRLLSEAPSNVISLSTARFPSDAPTSSPTSTPVQFRPYVRRKWIVTGALAGLAFILVGMWWIGSGWQRYITPDSEQRIVQLQDGSLLTINGRSKVEVRYSNAAREVRLLTGDASFKVAQETARPFRVHAGGSVIQAVGTEFHVLHRAREIRVAVLEGRVRISRQSDAETSQEPERRKQPDSSTGAKALQPLKPIQTQLNAGEEAHISVNGEISRALLGQRRLVFNNNRLDDVAETFNFYNRDVQIRVEDSAAAERRLTGTFNTNAPQSLILILAAEPGLRIERDGAAFVIRSR